MLLKYFINDERMTTSNAIDPFLAQVILSMLMRIYSQVRF